MKRRTRGLLAVAAASVTVVSGVAFAPAAIAAPADGPDPGRGPATRQPSRPAHRAPERAPQGRPEADPLRPGVARRGRSRPARRRQVLRGRRHRHRPAVHDPLRVRRPGQRQARVGARAAAQRRSPSPTAPSNNSTHWIAGLQHRVLRGPVLRRRASRSPTSTRSSRRATTPSTARSATGCRCPATPRPTATTPSRTSAAPGSSSRTPATPGTTPRSRPARATPTSRPSSPSFDVWDRYDADNDGNFDEPDGYLDHFQAVHAGEGEDAGGGAQGEDAIWSHRWYVNCTDYGITGPARREVRRRADRRHRLLDRRLHDRGRERRPRRVRARVRPRPRPARLLRHRRRREQHRVLDAHVERFVAEPRRRRHRHDARTTWVRGRSSSSAGSTTRSSTPGRADAVHAQPGRPAGRRPGPGARHRRARPGGRQRLHHAVLGDAGLVDAAAPTT